MANGQDKLVGSGTTGIGIIPQQSIEAIITVVANEHIGRICADAGLRLAEVTAVYRVGLELSQDGQNICGIGQGNNRIVTGLGNGDMTKAADLSTLKLTLNQRLYHGEGHCLTLQQVTLTTIIGVELKVNAVAAGG